MLVLSIGHMLVPREDFGDSNPLFVRIPQQFIRKLLELKGIKP